MIRRLICAALWHKMGKVDIYTLTFDCGRCNELVDIKMHPVWRTGSHKKG